jgi:hypothetical protein
MENTTLNTWQFLTNSYWYVDVPYLPALQLDLDDNQLCWRGDQTVWHITGYKHGYFWGVAATTLFDPDQANSRKPPRVAQSQLLGSVTPDGHVLISFLLRSNTQQGTGNMRQMGKEWAFQMQMSNAGGGNQTLHWASMLQTKPGEANFEKLPGVNYSIPEMLEGASYPTFADN